MKCEIRLIRSKLKWNAALNVGFETFFGRERGRERERELSEIVDAVKHNPTNKCIGILPTFHVIQCGYIRGKPSLTFATHFSDNYSLHKPNPVNSVPFVKTLQQPGKKCEPSQLNLGFLRGKRTAPKIFPHKSENFSDKSEKFFWTNLKIWQEM